MTLNPFKWLISLVRLIFRGIKNLFRPVFGPVFRFMRYVYTIIRRLWYLASDKIQQSLRLQLILTFAICLLAGMITASITSPIFERYNQHAYIDYSHEQSYINERARSIVDDLNRYKEKIKYQQDLEQYEQAKKDPNIKDIEYPHHDVYEGCITCGPNTVQEIVEQAARYNSLKVLIVDLDGKVLYKSETATEEQVDIHKIMQNIMDMNVGNQRYTSEREEFTSFYPVEIPDQKAYLIVKGIPNGYIVYRNMGSPWGGILGLIVFFLLFYYLTKVKMRQIEVLSNGLKEVSRGNLNYRVPVKSNDELGSLARNINHMTSELQRKIEEERRLEKMKNELITNVSHDLRTPLTSIIGYLRLLKDNKYESQEKMEEYIAIAAGKSEKLKQLIEDLFEYTKLTNQDKRLNIKSICLNEMLEQLVEEFVPLAEENQLELIREIPSERVMIDLDANQMARVFENLLSNAIKYSHKPSQIIIKLDIAAQHVRVTFENKGDNIAKEDLSKLFERFYKIDSARTSTTNGSGLGLAIAKSIVELHKGKIWADSENDVIRFHVELLKD